MAAPRGVRRVAQVQPIRTGDSTADKASDDLAVSVNTLARNILAQGVPLEVELEWGLNKIGHGLKVPVRHFMVAAGSDPTAVVTNRQDDNPVRDKQVWVHLDGPASATALLILLPVT